MACNSPHNQRVMRRRRVAAPPADPGGWHAARLQGIVTLQAGAVARRALLPKGAGALAAANAGASALRDRRPPPFRSTPRTGVARR